MASSNHLRGFRMEKDKEKHQTSMLRYIRQSHPNDRFSKGSASQSTNESKDSESVTSSTSENINTPASPIFKSLATQKKSLLVSGRSNATPATPILKTTFNSLSFTTPPSRPYIIKGSSSTSPNRLNIEIPSHPHSSKLFFVKPLSEEERNGHSNATAKESGFDMSSVLKDKLPSTANGNLSDDSNQTDVSNELSQDSFIGARSNFNKRMRIDSDDEDNNDTAAKRECLDETDGTSDNLESTYIATTTKYSASMIEKLLETYCEVYPTVDKMEIFEAMERWDYNFSEMTKCLDAVVKKQKKQNSNKMRGVEMEERKRAKMDKEREIEERRLAKMMEREKQKKIKAMEMKRKKVIWKMKARAHQADNEDEEEEEDDYIGKQKVYESDSSEEGSNEEEEEAEESISPMRMMVLEFFNDSSILELSSLPGCSKKKADVILQCRPFENWKDMVYKFKTERHITTDLLNSAKDILQMRTVIKNLMKKCERISSKIQTFVSEIIDGEEETSISEQPECLNPQMKLKHYQLIGLNWLVLMHDQQLNGVLADEMGLGKTIQAISFLGYLHDKGELDDKYCLIVVPTSTLDNWARELSIWAPSLGFLIYHGSQEERRGMRMEILNGELEENVCIIITSYNMVGSSAEDKAMFKRLPFHTIIYDEAHMLKNMTSLRYENLMKIRCTRRVLLTGTPLQNNLVELMSILIFVMPQLFEGRKEELKKVFSMFPKTESDESRGRYERERVQQAKRIMSPFFLRRLKEDVLKDLPSKTDEVLHVAMSERQEMMYKSTIEVLNKRAEEMKEELEKIKLQDLDELANLEIKVVPGSSKSPPSKTPTTEDSSSNMLMKLRKLANHPLLLRNKYTDATIKEMSKILKSTTHKESILDYIIQDFSVMSDFEIHQTCCTFQPISEFKLTPEMIVSSGKMEMLDKMLPEMAEKGDRVLIFSQFVIVLNLLEEYLKIRGYQYRRLDGTTQVANRQEMIDDFTEDDRIFIFLLSTRAGGLGINLSAANTVIIHDIDFNPYNDKQAEDRCHRVGQTRNVKVYRFICKNSIEEGMFQIANSKLQLEKDVTGKGDNEDQRKGDVVALLKTALRVNNSE